MSVYHAAIGTSEDYIERRAKHRQAHLDRIVGLRAQGLVVAGGPAPDGRTAEIFYRVQQPSDVNRLVEEDPYYLAGAWKSYTLRAFTEFVEPLDLPPLAADGSRRVTLVEGVALRADKASLGGRGDPRAADDHGRRRGARLAGGNRPLGRRKPQRAALPPRAVTNLRPKGDVAL